MKKLLYGLICSLLLITPGGKTAIAQDKPHVAIRLVPEKTHVEPGEAIYIAIEQTIDQGWHTYWVNPGDSGEKPNIEWNLPAGFEAQDIKWPTPEKIRTGPLATYGYENKAVLLQTMYIAEDLAEGPLTLKANIEILVCADTCIPEFSTQELTLNGPGEAQDNTELIDAAFFALPTEAVWPSLYHEENGEFIVKFEIETPYVIETFAQAPDFTLMMEEWGIVDNAAGTDTTLKGNVLEFHQKRGDRLLSSLNELHGIFSYLDKSGTRKAYLFMARPDKKAMEAVAAATPTPAAPTADKAQKKSDIPLAQALLFALLGGLVLNLMPCVFPVLSLKALKLCKLSGQELRQARIDSLFYTIGIIASFLCFAFLLLALRSAGKQIGWGFQLQSPGFVLFLTWLLFLIGLNLSGFYDIGNRLTGAGSRFIKGHGYAASFFTGVLAAVVATPCVAPFMAVAIGFAVTQPVSVVLSVFLSLALGLALPYILLATVPALRTALPKPGAWMETFRQFLAFPLYGAAIWLAWVYTRQNEMMGILVVLSGALALVFAIWILKKAPQTGLHAVVLKLLGLAFILLTLGLLVCASGHMPIARPAVATAENGWLPYSKAEFAKLEAGNDPIFVDMTAAWCITCKINERVALSSEEIRKLFDEHRISPVKGDWTNYNAEITAFLESYGRNGVPLYVYYGPRDERTGQRPAPEVLPQLLTPGIVKQAIVKQK
jgi:thiol:disulfide interchange protein/DsbC/DsbD-like thiol-disulfide interchange protein